MAALVTPRRSTSRSHAAAENPRMTTTVPPVTKVQPIATQEMFENSPSEQSVTAARS